MTDLSLSAIAVSGFILVGFLLSRVWKRNDVADGLWGLGFVAVATFHALSSETLSLRGQIVFGLTLVWAARLSSYLFGRMIGKPEDKRYAAWRKNWGSKEPLYAFLKVFLLQGSVLAIVSLPLMTGVRSDSPLTYLDAAGVLLFLFGFLIETSADMQLAEFKSHSPQGICREGLWKYSRHPNYLGEILVWWGFFLLSTQYWTIVSPLLITFLLVKVSGVAMLDRFMAQRGKDFDSYRDTTPALIPFRLTDLKKFCIALLTILLLDLFWLGGVMNEFYVKQIGNLGRLDVNGFAPLYPAVAGVYFLIPFGVLFFAQGKPSWAFFKGSIYGLVLYGVYEFTNLSLVKNWPLEMALVDLIWGPALCGISAWVVSRWEA